jgi:hypothetical protein
MLPIGSGTVVKHSPLNSKVKGSRPRSLLRFSHLSGHALLEDEEAHDAAGGAGQAGEAVHNHPRVFLNKKKTVTNDPAYLFGIAIVGKVRNVAVPNVSKGP